ncbi:MULTISPECIES: ABC transporter substrate-binding protein [Ramlibacter]|uniref:ABC transporter substrate-binding protein n=1 Tax=Ramlibacter pinisoli TaxID=2682844 RepID=A0A6N8INJ9_9BURK|nr:MULTISPECIES: ABC transporter substrate-binding protein [Ramlibacter]MBA2960559.1 ABC transporter substrate-binding protein [Ramlibacter sp. CGMCC 1.13660]MVQ27890.1 ABC transporter substrate-binding protein [Ramlibacter pinisoli]
MKTSSLRRALVVALAAAVPLAALAQDKIKVGVFPSSSALPFYVALERGYFKEAGIEPEAVVFNAHPLTVQALVTGDVQAAANLVTLEGANINQRRPGTLSYISLNGQNAQYITEQFIVKNGSTAKTLADLKGAKILSAPGPANLGAAKAVLKAAGLEEGKDYSIQEQQMGVHVGALQAGTFDAGYTLEPVASVAIRNGAARRLEAGVISTYLLGRKEALAFAAGGALSGEFLAKQPAVAARYAAAWAKAVKDVDTDPKVRDLLPKYMNTSAEIAPTVPLAKIVMVKDLKAQDLTDFQKFVDIGVAQGVVKGAVDTKSMVKAF